jgi:hypothetical protein
VLILWLVKTLRSVERIVLSLEFKTLLSLRLKVLAYRTKVIVKLL